MKKGIAILVLVFWCFYIKAQEITPGVQIRAKSLLNQMTLKEKIDYIGGFKQFYIRAIPRLGIPEIRMADGPQGVRNDTKSTLYPCGIATASTWNRQLMYNIGEGLGMDCRARGVNILLGPGVNLYRSPLCGRNFEYFGEDPYLSSETAVQYIKGVQSQHVIATVKHFIANNEEYDRHNVSSDIDKRTLNEVYAVPFRKAVEKANVGAVMNSYNLLNGVHTSENEYLNIELLRNMWGFKGILMSDWGSVYSAVGAANGGLDIEMGYAKYMNYENLSKAIDKGLVSIKTIDEKVLHILETIIAFGIFDHPQKDSTIPEKNPYTENIALQDAREGIVLLKNDDDILPLKGKTLVLGPNMDKMPIGGGSGFVNPFTVVTLYDGLKTLPNSGDYDFISDLELSTDLIKTGEFFTGTKSEIQGLKAEYFKNDNFVGTPDYVGVDNAIDFNLKAGSIKANFPTDHFSTRWTGVFKPKNAGRYKFKLSADDGYRLYFDKKEILSDWKAHQFSGKDVIVNVEAGNEYPIKIEYFEGTGEAKVNFSVTFIREEDYFAKKLKACKNVILNIGLDKALERENFDRPFELPKEQTDLIEKVSKYNKNIIVIINAGGGVEMSSWKDKVKGILMAWYPGQQGGQALTEIISGKISPSGKLPISIESKPEDNPTYDNYYDKRSNITHKRVQYNEGVFLGYKGYDKLGIEPLYPFGFGLSYSSFEYSNLIIKKQNGNNITVSFTIKNIGKYDAAEIAEIYVGDEIASVARPLKELKGFEKVFLKKGESKEINIELDDEAFSFFDINSNKFMVELGEFIISVGASSKDIRLKQKIMI